MRALVNKRLVAVVVLVLIIATVAGSYAVGSYLFPRKPLLCSSEPLYSQALVRMDHKFQSPEQLHIWYGQDYYSNFVSSTLGHQVYVGTLTSEYSTYSALVNGGKDAPFNMAYGDMASGLWYQEGTLIQVFVCED